ncbi:leucine-rich repeat-containing protein kinase family protein [Rhodoferax sp.]|uniref:leucine-rich repeat-containing protein kinase family protein n=1 Tax=Rhodoferax sp. TaxID=50421 RepID=UPI0025F9280E|nr:leucine-rich repeat-containing protein kinase family protein [Rhodoferax sp.]
MHTLSQLRSGQLQGIRRLDLSGGLTTFPHEIFDLADTLEVLNLSGNALSALPDDLPRLHRLRVVFCSGNPFTELPAVLGQCAQLEMVGFKSCQIRHVPAAALPPRLRWLILTDNHITTLPAEIGQCQQMQKLMLAGNQLQQLPPELAQCQQLELLRISANPMADAGTLPDWLLQLPLLAWLARAGTPHIAPSTTPIRWTDLAVQQPLGEGASGVIHQAQWRGKTVAVKLFKGEVTSDGWPQSELAACLAVGAHPHLIGTLGPLVDHPQGTTGLVMPCIPPHFTTLAGPPSLDSCTRDIYPAGTVFSLATVLRTAQGVASAAAHLHAGGLLHGDLYAHNLQCSADGHCLLGDMGAASFLPADAVQAQALQRLEVRAFGCLLEELLAHCPENTAKLTLLRNDCLQTAVALRPLFAQIVQRLHSIELQKDLADAA